MRDHKKFSRRAFSFAVAGVTAFLAVGSAEAAVMSFNATGAATGGMLPGDTAGAVAVGNWNNMNAVQATGGGPIAGTLAAGSIVNDAGAVQALTTLTWNGTGVATAGGSGTNSQRMFESEWDLFDSASVTATPDMTINVTNIPYAAYDVYFYVQDASNAAQRGGDVSANGVTKSIRMFNSPGDIPGGPTAYVEADSLPPWSDTTTDQGTYLRLPNITGDLALTISSKNVSVPRIRFSGFQIVEVPEPSAAAVGGIAALGLLSARRRRAIHASCQD